MSQEKARLNKLMAQREMEAIKMSQLKCNVTVHRVVPTVDSEGKAAYYNKAEIFENSGLPVMTNAGLLQLDVRATKEGENDAIYQFPLSQLVDLLIELIQPEVTNEREGAKKMAEEFLAKKEEKSIVTP